MEIGITVIGWAGTVLLLGAYALLTAGILSPRTLRYQGMNLVGAVFLMANTAYHSAWPSTALNLVWLVIGVSGLIQARRRGPDGPAAVPGAPPPQGGAA